MGYKMKRGAAPKFKELGSSPVKQNGGHGMILDSLDEQSPDAAKKRGDIVDLTIKPVGPRATPKPSKEVAGDVDLSPGYEDPIKIQKVQREGITPDSQKFSKNAKKRTQEQIEDAMGVGTNIKMPKVFKDGKKNKSIYKGKIVD